MSKKHSIKVNLYDSTFTENPDDYIARVHAESSLGVREICETAVERGGADISAASMEHAVHLWLAEMGYQLCDGFSVNTGYFVANIGIKGIFDSPNETYNPQKHTLLFEFHQGEKLRREVHNIGVEVLGVADVGVMIAQVVDVKTGTVNDRLTPGRNLRISGNRIKIAGDSPGNGLFFVDANSGTRVQVDASDIAVNNPSEIMIIIPSLPAGQYHLEIVTQFTSGGKSIKEPRRAMFDKTLTVD